MQITSLSVALAILNFVSPIAGHCVFIGAVGDVKGSQNGRALGGSETVPRNGVEQSRFQRDTPVFASPVVPWTKPNCWDGKCCKKGPYACYAKGYYTPIKRVYQPAGCGINLNYVNVVSQKKWPAVYKKSNVAQKNVYFYQRHIPGAEINIAGETARNIRDKRLPTASAGGYLKLTLHQINQDGAGAFKCRVDLKGDGKHWSGWLPVTGNVVGNKLSINKYSLKRWWFTVKLPNNLNCQGTSSGKKKICILRCENSARNGPFGGCIPFQQYVPPPKVVYKPPPPPPPAPVPADYTATPEDEPEPVEYTADPNDYSSYSSPDVNITAPVTAVSEDDYVDSEDTATANLDSEDMDDEE